MESFTFQAVADPAFEDATVGVALHELILVARHVCCNTNGTFDVVLGL